MVMEEYQAAALQQVRYRQWPDGSYFAYIAGFPGDGVWAMGATQAACADALSLALHRKVALILDLGQGNLLPLFDGVRPDPARRTGELVPG